MRILGVTISLAQKCRECGNPTLTLQQGKCPICWLMDPKGGE